MPNESSPTISSENGSLASPTGRLTVRSAVERARELLSGVAWHLGLGRRSRIGRVDNAAKLRDFIDSHASHVAQSSLYGYLKARAGTRFPDLFENDGFLVSINHAKWQVWAATLSDLSVFAGGLVQRRSERRDDEVNLLMDWIVGDILARTGTPPDSGPDFSTSIDKLRRRIAECDFSEVSDNSDSFTESPDALVLFAPVIEKYKQLDAEIVRNSVRFRWIEVRRMLRSLLDADAIVDEFKTAKESDSATQS